MRNGPPLAEQAKRSISFAGFGLSTERQRMLGGWFSWLGKLGSRKYRVHGERNSHANELFALNRRVMKAYLLKESLDRLWNYTYEGAMLRYLKSWIDQCAGSG